MERKVTKLEHSHVEVVVTVDEASWKAAQKKAFDKLAANVTVDGFRKGKAPQSLVEKKVNTAQVMDDAINALLPQLYNEVIVEEKLNPFIQPKVDVTKLSDKELEVKFLIVTAPEVKLGKYTGLEIGKKEAKVTAKEVETAIDALRKQNATLSLKEGAAALGDTVVIDFVGSVDGKEFDGGAAENYELELGSNSFIPGFEDQLVGMSADEKKNINVKFPENYVAELKGKDAVFAITVHEVKEKKLPEINEEFIKELNMPNVTNLDELKEAKKAELKKNKENQLHNEYMGKLLDEIAKTAEVDMPSEIIDSQMKNRKNDLVKRMEQSGLTLEQYLQMTGQDEAKFEAELRTQTTKELTNYLLTDAIGHQEKIDVDEKDLDFEMAKLADQYSMSIDQVKNALEKQMDEFRYNIRMERIDNFLYSNNN